MSSSMMDDLHAFQDAQVKYHEANAQVALVAQEYLAGRATHDELANASAAAVVATHARDAAWRVYYGHKQACR